MVEVVSVIENFSSSPELREEHGLSLYIRHKDKNYLLDTGASDKFLINAKTLGLDLTALDGIIISHNHYDHTGGLPALLELNKDVKVYIKSAAKSEFYYKNAFIKKNLGEKKGLFKKYEDKFVFLDGDLELSDSVKLISNTVHDSAYGCKDTKLFEKKNGKFIPDQYLHELFMTIEENGKLVILSSCSHNGIVNILNTVKEKFPGTPISHIIGGFHFAAVGPGTKSSQMNCTEEYVKEVAGILGDTCSQIHTCHCTGKTAFHIMKDELADRITYFDTGKKILID